MFVSDKNAFIVFVNHSKHDKENKDDTQLGRRMR